MCALRLFLALDLPIDIKNELTRAQGILREKYSAKLRFISRDNLHLTVKFLGAVSEEQFAAVKSTLSRVGEALSPFALTLSGAGVFPLRGAPKIAWVGANDHSDMQLCHQCVETAYGALGFPRDEHSFTPHITIARSQGRGAPQTLRGECTALSIQPLKFAAAGLTLYRSHVAANGSAYELIEQARFSAICAN